MMMDADGCLQMYRNGCQVCSLPLDSYAIFYPIKILRDVLIDTTISKFNLDVVVFTVLEWRNNLRAISVFLFTRSLHLLQLPIVSIENIQQTFLNAGYSL